MPKAVINKDTLVGDAVAVHPETEEVFLNIGMHDLNNPIIRSQTVAEACAMAGVDADSVINEINLRITSDR